MRLVCNQANAPCAGSPHKPCELWPYPDAPICKLRTDFPKCSLVTLEKAHCWPLQTTPDGILQRAISMYLYFWLCLAHSDWTRACELGKRTLVKQLKVTLLIPGLTNRKICCHCPLDKQLACGATRQGHLKGLQGASRPQRIQCCITA